MRVLFTMQPSSGHWHPLVPLAQVLEVQGHEVLFASMPGFGPTVEAKGFHYWSVGLTRVRKRPSNSGKKRQDL